MRKTAWAREKIADISAESPDFTRTDGKILSVILILCDVVDAQEATIEKLYAENTK